MHNNWDAAGGLLSGLAPVLTVNKLSGELQLQFCSCFLPFFNFFGLSLREGLENDFHVL